MHRDPFLKPPPRVIGFCPLSVAFSLVVLSRLKMSNIVVSFETQTSVPRWAPSLCLLVQRNGKFFKWIFKLCNSLIISHLRDLDLL